MEIKCVWEHNGNDTLLYAEDYVGAFTRGKNLDIALEKCRMKFSHIWRGVVKVKKQ